MFEIRLQLDLPFLCVCVFTLFLFSLCNLLLNVFCATLLHLLRSFAWYEDDHLTFFVSFELKALIIFFFVGFCIFVNYSLLIINDI